MKTITEEEWNAEGVRLFGEDRENWRFVCPSCGHVASVKDWRDAGAPANAIAFSCVGRWTDTKAEIFAKKGPCNYAGGGLFQLNPISVTREDGETSVFAFAESQPAAPTRDDRSVVAQAQEGA